MEQDKQKSTYLALLTASLEKKSKVLDELLSLTKLQENYIDNSNIDSDEFDQIFDKKEKQIQELLTLDKGFEQIFEHIKEEIAQNKEKYINEIKKMQELITEVTDKNVNLQALEQRNRMKLDTLLKTKRSNIKNFKLSSKTAASYYRNMANQHQGQSYFFDRKK